MRIICPYCFKEFNDDEVLFRSERVTREDSPVLDYDVNGVDDYDSPEDFRARYPERDKNKKERLLLQLEEDEFFREEEDPVYTEWWEKFNGTTEVDPVDEARGIHPYMRKIIRPEDPIHQNFLMKKEMGGYYGKEAVGEDDIVTYITLKSGERCFTRVCPACHNPLPVGYGKCPVKFTSVIGISGAGKTVYLSQLLKNMKEYAAKVNLSATVNNIEVRRFLAENRIEAGHRVPGSTPKEKFQQPVFYELSMSKNDNTRVTNTLVMYDVAGELFKDGLTREVEQFAPFVRHSDGIIVLIDPMQFVNVYSTQLDKPGLQEPETVLDAIHSILVADPTKKASTPLAVAISKVDTPEIQSVMLDSLKSCLLADVDGVPNDRGGAIYKSQFNATVYNPLAKELKAFFSRNATSLATYLYSNYEKFNYFAFTALGCAVKEAVADSGERYQYPEGPVLPKRIEEPVLWLFKEYGYIGANEMIYSPAARVLCCPKCGRKGAMEYDEPQWSTKKHGLFNLFKTKKLVKYYCCNANCGYEWNEDEMKFDTEG